MSLSIKNITYVSAFLDLYDIDEKRSKIRSPEKCFEYFSKLSSTGIKICFFVSKIYEDYAKKMCELYPNISLIQTLELEELNTYKLSLSVEDVGLPFNRTEYKDTKNYMIMMNAKTELVKKVIDTNPHNSTHYAWIDFSVCHILKYDTTLEKLKELDLRLENIKNVILPGCWSRELSDQTMMTGLIYHCINWRFCGGFFIGDKESILDFCKKYDEHFLTFLQTHKRIVWEVNFWAWLESQNYWSPLVYMAKHDDSMLLIP